ncbi:FHA domain-containing protein [Phytomonospora sp. NPDC050363]|uniref:FHA domain-containing protein n=1 Tax=Phytomonospora sp. NPDC050363 TaxID=3155642 RepID=UPI0033D94F09
MNATTQFSVMPQPQGAPQPAGWFAPEAQPCPECGEPLLDRFCEACGWGPGVAPAVPSGPVPQQAPNQPFDPFSQGGAPPPGPVPAPFPPPAPAHDGGQGYPPPAPQNGPAQGFPPAPDSGPVQAFPPPPEAPPAFATPSAQPADPFAAAFPQQQQQPPPQVHGPGPWQLIADADRAYFERICRMNDLDPNTMQFPAYVPQRFFRLHGPQLLLGRRSASKGINPDIDLSGPPTDAAVSHAHALFLAQPDGTWAIVDVGSSNGTFVNDSQQALVRHQPQQLNVGDRVHVGLWTTLTVTTGM